MPKPRPFVERGGPNPFETRRGQTTLAGLAVALVLLTTVTAGSIVAADRALADATSSPLEQHRAERAAEALVTDGPITTSDGYVSPSLANETNASELSTAVPALRGVSFTVRFAGREIARQGTVTDGSRVSRGVVVVETRTDSERIELEDGMVGTLDGQTDEIQVDIDPRNNTTVRTIRVDDRVVLHRPTGLRGTHTVAVSSYASPVVRVEAAGDDPEGTVTVTATVFETRTERVEVSVDA
ncbi:MULTISPECIES: hypothetical protein [Haloferax]|uniref:Uncharacterized protein n=1 Tax=Haloferax marinum TaxID=2666143 RepID=A0A6A8G6D8_9EURY|nr:MULTISPECIES: hypothetical protein [Haloferax]KAB1197162.1 hypothetical protein Hfx1150_06380 [Haloferax sp. CBA1150]MRW96198.1 hypothetical protein [Haloferax marinum]